MQYPYHLNPNDGFMIYMNGRNQAAVTFGGSVYLAHALLSLATISLLSDAVNLSTTEFLQLWTSTILAFVFGFFLLLAGLLIGSDSDLRQIAGGIVGFLSAIIGAVNAVVLLNNVEGIGSSTNLVNTIGSSAQLQLFFLLLIPATFVALFVGFPIGMVGSFQNVKEKGDENFEQQ